MPLQFLHNLTSREGTRRTNRQLGCLLALVAGAINTGGFLAVRRYTSHMTGIVSAMADDLVLGRIGLVLAGIAFLLAFIAAAATTAVLVNWARRHGMQGEFALPAIVEAALLLVFGLLGANLNVLVELFVPTTVLVLCFIMGLQKLAGGILGAAAFKAIGYTAVLPIAATLVAISAMPLIVDATSLWRRTHPP